MTCNGQIIALNLFKRMGPDGDDEEQEDEDDDMLIGNIRLITTPSRTLSTLNGSLLTGVCN